MLDKDGFIVVIGCLADIGFIVDASSSVGVDNWAKTITFMKTFVSKLNIGSTATQVSLRLHDNIHLLNIDNFHNIDLISTTPLNIS